MTYQPKVNKTQTYFDGQGEHIVCEGKLVFIQENRLPKLNDLVYHGNNGYSIIKDEEHLDFALSVHKQAYYLPIKPIIISETEEIEVGDWVYDLYSTGGETPKIVQVVSFDNALYKFDNGTSRLRPTLYKILALPEHFSESHLQAIVGGKIKDSDEVLVKCETMYELDGKLKQVPHEKESKVVKIISLDLNNHITLFPVKQSLEDAADEWKNDRYHYVGGGYFDTYDIKAAFKAGAEWAKKNNY